MFNQWLTRVGNSLPVSIEWLSSASLAVFLLVGPETILFRVPTFVALLAVLTFPRLGQSEYLWFTLAGLYAFDLGVNWQTMNTFLYLIWYWTLTMALLRGQSGDHMTYLATPARLLLAVHFLLAAISKFLSPDFVSGQTMAFLLLHEPRMFPITLLATGVDLDTLNHNRQLLNTTIDNPSAAEVSISNPGAGFTAMALTYHTLFLEAALAVMFFLRLPMRDHALLYFVLTTQLVMTVIGFAALHCLLGYVQANDGRMRVLYLIGFILSAIAVLLIPLRDWLLKVS